MNIQLRQINNQVFALSQKVFPGCVLSEDGFRVHGSVITDDSMDNATFYRVYGDGVLDCLEKSGDEWQNIENPELIGNACIFAIEDDANLYYANGKDIIYAA
jgi:hypothetical protein